MSEQQQSTWEEPKPLETPLELHRVARPLRQVKYIPTKSLVFYSKNTPPQFTYDIKIKLPIKSKSVIVQVLYVGLNPVDLKIYNSYTTNMNSYTGLGREFVGKITHLGKDVIGAGKYKVDDVVMGTYFHPNMGMGTLQTSIELDTTKDVFFLKPESLALQEAAGASYALGASYSLLSSIKSRNPKLLTLNEGKSPNILINGGGSNLGMFCLQLLKYHYKIQSKITLVCSDYAMQTIKSHFPDLIDDLIFVNYISCNSKPSKVLKNMIKDHEIIEYVHINGSSNKTMNSIPYDQGKYDLVLDFVGGYDLIENSNSLISNNAEYVTTVGDYKFNYKKDVYTFFGLQKMMKNSDLGRSVWSKLTWNFNYTHFQFDPSLSYNESYYNNWKDNVHDLLENHTIKIIVDKVYQWKNYDEAFKYLKAGHTHGKVVLEVEMF